MSVKLLSELNDNILVALRAHREFSDIFLFVGMRGLSMQHEYQYDSERLVQRRVKKYLMSTYHVHETDHPTESANIAGKLLSGKNRKALKSDEIRHIVREGVFEYESQEERNIKKYEKIAMELFNSGEISAFHFTSDIIRDVKNELTHLQDKIVELCAHDFDMAQVVEEQDTMAEKYTYLIKNLHADVPDFHHKNSFISADDRGIYDGKRL